MLDAPEGAMTLRVKGHARFAAPRSDIVCAAASALVWAAIGSVEELSARGGLTARRCCARKRAQRTYTRGQVPAPRRILPGRRGR